MKLLDPFAGYRLASGHPFFHVALFICSWFVLTIGDNDFVSDDSIITAFELLRWAHFTLIFLAIIQSFVNRPSTVPEVVELGPEAIEDERELEKSKVIHRDGSFKLFSRMLATLSVFVYQGAVFFAQMVLAKDLFI
jgi:hypothetical protein|mmetsp:Transcript_6940/g.9639  ORF Transcript_6940/g.9639 Transcript_6940/m.9639 type:complete len:136 (+) Transcript_6940:43-450(+)